MCNISKDSADLNFNKAILVEKISSSLYTKSILNLYLTYELNNWPNKSINNVTRKESFIWYSQINKKRNENQNYL